MIPEGKANLHTVAFDTALAKTAGSLPNQPVVLPHTPLNHLSQLLNHLNQLLSQVIKEEQKKNRLKGER